MIPAHAFNDASTPTSTDTLSAGERLEKAFHRLNSISPSSNDIGFELKASQIKINDLTINAASTSGMFIEKLDIPAFEFVFPIAGTGFTEVEGVRFGYHAGRNGFVGTSEKHIAGLTGSAVEIRFNLKRLQRTMSSMLGLDHEQPIATEARIVSLQANGVSFPELFKNLFYQIDSATGNTGILEKLALDDSFYRLGAGVLRPDIFLIDEPLNGRTPFVRREIGRLCEHITANLTQQISLTEMERISGLSGRVLQRSFQIAFSLTPKEWVRKQRLHAARRLLEKPTENNTVTSVSYDFCFASPSNFAHHYLREFGELPSHTLRVRNG